MYNPYTDRPDDLPLADTQHGALLLPSGPSTMVLEREVATADGLAVVSLIVGLAAFATSGKNTTVVQQIPNAAGISALATAAPPDVASAGVVGTSSNAARQDHTHGGIQLAGDLGNTFALPHVTAINGTTVLGATTQTNLGAGASQKALLLDAGGLANGVNLNNISTGGSADSVLHGAGGNYGNITEANLAAGPALKGGVTTLVAGVSPAIVATITATSKIVAFLKVPVPGAGNLTVQFAALATDRVNGAPGSFKITALISAGTINILDTSTLDWMVLG